MFWENWQSLVNVAITGIFTYVALIAFLRVSGKRTLSKMNMFDFVVTIALGSIFATIIVSTEVTFGRGIVALLTLILSQYVLTSLSTRFNWFQDLVKGEPTLLYYNGRFLLNVMHAERVTREEVFQAMRKGGLLSLEQVSAVVLETDGSFTAIPATNQPMDTRSLTASSLQNLPLDGVDDTVEKGHGEST